MSEWIGKNADGIVIPTEVKVPFLIRKIVILLSHNDKLMNSIRYRKKKHKNRNV